MDGGRKNSAADEKELLDKIVVMRLKVPDDLVNVNSLFTVAVFIGLSFANPDQRSLENRKECDPNSVMAKQLIMFEVLSFSFFLVSSLAAKSLKVLLNIFKLSEVMEFGSPLSRKIFHSTLLRRTMLSTSTWASASGVFFLTLSMVYVIQIRLGKLSCGSAYTLKSVIPMIVLVAISLILYLPPMLYVARASFKINNYKPPITVMQSVE